MERELKESIDLLTTEQRELVLVRAAEAVVEAELKRKIRRLCDVVWEWRYLYSRYPHSFRDAPTSGSGAEPQRVRACVAPSPPSYSWPAEFPRWGSK